MPTLRRLWQGIANFRLEYPVSRPYPWRWLTPAALACMLILTILVTLISSYGIALSNTEFHLLTSISVPLAAYDRVTEFTYFPNITDDTNHFWSFIPSALKKDTDEESFTPQTISVGDTLSVNGSIYSYTVTDSLCYPRFRAQYFQAALDLSWTVSSHPEGWSIDDQEQKGPAIINFGIKVTVECWIPVNYTLTLDTRDLVSDALSLTGHVQDNWRRELFLMQPFLRARLRLAYSNAALLENVQGQLRPGDEAIFASRIVPSYTDAESIAPFSKPTNMSHDFHIVMYKLYHSIRLDLGIVEPNLIFNSSEMMRQLIGDFRDSSITIQERQHIEDLNQTVHTPSFSYSRSVWRRKPIGSAIVSVYTATFTIISLVWTIFSLTAAFLAGVRDDSQKVYAGYDDLEMRIQRLEVGGRFRPASPSALQADTSELNAYLDKQYPHSARASNTDDNESVPEERSTLMHNVSLGDASRHRAGSPDDSR
ncbi:hypothetical protein CYLTODRAFT_414253 [Cylindrobasidium torrendii FP15055 ss-10]|uniref:Uncharacterized protein n=1 Tax=Cylindrobasidium torrendii FP15055 ss-10 TaxID=1314674 RepID=A0A0D7B0R7_9AGAR|nr:hypothetical protein CYLTODRAFT_414253 [Cylindrobasidium torrendii FP15055 ss-10]